MARTIDTCLRRMSRFGPWLVAAPALLLALPLNAGRALAHAHYDHSTPAIGAVLGAPPARVDIWTDQEMAKAGTANSITVTNAAGQPVQSGAATLDDTDRTHLFVAMQPNLPAGRYVVSFTT
ncbi:MAG TPA: copper resistance protein CopC, partial [Dehalococcoidia bacterium]